MALDKPYGSVPQTSASTMGLDHGLDLVVGTSDYHPSGAREVRDVGSNAT